MDPFPYHPGQREVQREANSVACADKLATWVGPVAEFASIADLIVLAHRSATRFEIAALSGPAPLVSATQDDGAVAIRFPRGLEALLPVGAPIGGIVIKPAEARRSRISGALSRAGDELELRCALAFTNCRKYMAPTVSEGAAGHLGPHHRVPLAIGDPWVARTVAAAETAFLVTATPAGCADVSHRGGPPGFLRFDGPGATVEWTEYLGDGMFVSTGNLRADDRFGLVVLDYATGDAVWLEGRARYDNIRTDRKERVDALIQAGEPFPVQGKLRATITAAERLAGLTHPRRRLAERTRITSTDTTATQHPQ